MRIFVLLLAVVTFGFCQSTTKKIGDTYYTTDSDNNTTTTKKIGGTYYSTDSDNNTTTTKKIGGTYYSTEPKVKTSTYKPYIYDSDSDD